ncbi:hypothetical protein BJ742DRAFT_798623 [Cladochytrium replicatum]|nr:hypothetical protein BJ742DRAFT_798623 [Cladochytrium replicatum]
MPKRERNRSWKDEADGDVDVANEGNALYQSRLEDLLGMQFDFDTPQHHDATTDPTPSTNITNTEPMRFNLFSSTTSSSHEPSSPKRHKSRTLELVSLDAGSANTQSADIHNLSAKSAHERWKNRLRLGSARLKKPKSSVDAPGVVVNSKSLLESSVPLGNHGRQLFSFKIDGPRRGYEDSKKYLVRWNYVVGLGGCNEKEANRRKRVAARMGWEYEGENMTKEYRRRSKEEKGKRKQKSQKRRRLEKFAKESGVSLEKAASMTREKKKAERGPRKGTTTFRSQLR